MKTSRSPRSMIRSLRIPLATAPDEKPSGGQACRQQAPAQAPPFREGDVVEYGASPHRRLIVAHCYRREVEGDRRWIVAEINADTHPADELRLVTPD